MLFDIRSNALFCAACSAVATVHTAQGASIVVLSLWFRTALLFRFVQAVTSLLLLFMSLSIQERELAAELAQTRRACNEAKRTVQCVCICA